MKTFLTALAITIIALLINIQTTKAQCHIGDWTALKALYESTNGDNWTNNSGWDVQIAPYNSPPANCNLADLYGVTLDGTGRVSCIDLDGDPNCAISYGGDGNNLTGPLPPQIGDLSNLIILTLSNNQVNGSLPSELGNLSNLSELILFYNQISGSIPSSLGNLNNLTRLIIYSNNLSGNIPSSLGSLNNLSHLGMSLNNLSGSIPPELGSLSNLLILRLGANSLSGSIPPELANLNVYQLYLYNNQLTGNIPPELGNSSNLTYLLLDDNLLSGSIPPELGNSGIKQLDLYNNQLTGNIPSELANMASLNVIRIYNNQLSGCYDQNLNNWCGTFDNADISDGNFFNAPFEDFCASDINTCTQCHIDDWTALKALYESTNGDNWFNRTGWDVQIANQSSPPANCNLNNLYGIELDSDGRVSCLDLDGEDNCAISYVNGGNNLNGQLPAELGNLSNLETIRLSRNPIGGTIPPELGNLSNLNTLVLDRNQLVGSIPPELSKGVFSELCHC